MPLLPGGSDQKGQLARYLPFLLPSLRDHSPLLLPRLSVEPRTAPLQGLWAMSTLRGQTSPHPFMGKSEPLPSLQRQAPTRLCAVQCGGLSEELCNWQVPPHPGCVTLESPQPPSLSLPHQYNSTDFPGVERASHGIKRGCAL